MSFELPAASGAPPVRAWRMRLPAAPRKEKTALAFLSDDPLVPLPVIDLEPLPEPPSAAPDPRAFAAGSAMLPRPGLILDIRV